MSTAAPSNVQPSSADQVRPHLSMTEGVREAMRDVYRDLRIKDAIGLGAAETVAGENRHIGASLTIRFIPPGTPDFPTDTACWYYDSTEKRAHICLGEAIGGHVVKNHDRFGEYAGLYTYHEAAHDRWTTRELTKALAQAKASGVTGDELNIFEDARIEDRARRNWDVKFTWAQFEKTPPVEAATPLSVFNAFIWNNGDRGAARAMAAAGGVPGPTIDQVEGFYARTLEAPSTEAVIPIIVDFKKAFANPAPGAGSTPEGSAGEGGSGSRGAPGGAQGSAGAPAGGRRRKGSGKGARKDGEGKAPSAGAGSAGAGASGAAGSDGAAGSGGSSGSSTAASPASPGASPAPTVVNPRLKDLELAAAMAGDPSKAAAIVATSSVAAGPKPEGVGSGPLTTGREGDVVVREFTTGPITSSVPGRYDYEPPAARVQRCLATLLPVFAGRERREYSEGPTRRLDPRRFMDARDDVWTKKVPDGFIGQRDVAVFFDCSGSMNGKPNQSGKDLLMVMNELQRRGKITGHVVLHNVRRYEARYQTLRLPVPEKLIAGIPANGDAEGIAHAFAGCQRLIERKDMVMLYTDGNITDAPISDRSALHAKGIFTYGLYVGPSSAASKLGRYTDFPIRASSSEELVQLFAGQVLKSGFNKIRR